MAPKKDQEVTPESVDEMTDDQIAALMQGEGDPATETGQEAPEQGAEAAQEGEQQQAGADAGAEDGGGDGGEPEKAESVPFKRFDHERNRRREAERRAEQERAEWQRRFDELLKAGGPKQAPEDRPKPTIPDPNDPLGRLNFVFERVQQFEQQTAEQQRQAQLEAEQRQATERLLQESVQEYNVALEGDPTLGQAYEALIQSFQAEVGAYRLPPQQASAYLQNLELQHMAYARQNGIPLPEYIKGLATARGWRPEPVAPEQQPTPPKQAEGPKRAKSLSNGGGSPGVTPGLTAEQILNMSDAEFDALVKQHGSLSAALSQ